MSINNTTAETTEVRRCSTCRCNQLLIEENFKLNRKGEFLKTCIRCAARIKQNRSDHKCPHGRRKFQCIDCEGASTCEHRKQKHQCKDCCLLSYLNKVLACRIHDVVPKTGRPTKEILGCDMQEFKEHLESKFTDGMSWDNRELWHIDHIVPINYRNPETSDAPSIEVLFERLHFTNTKPMWATDNLKKGARFIG